MKIRVADYIAGFFAERGMNDCFMITGGGAMHLNDAFGHHPDMHCIFPHHEQAAAMAAEGYARVTGRMAPVVVTSGPGGTNTLTGVMGAWVDSIPLFVISGQIKRATSVHACPELPLRQLGDQEYDITGTVDKMTKYAVFVDRAEDIAYHLEKAALLAVSGRPGPVWLDVPMDIQAATVEETALHHLSREEANRLSAVPVADQTQVAEVAALLSHAKAPAFLVGTGIHVAGGEEALAALLKRFPLPTLVAWNANDLLATDHPLYSGMPGTVGTRQGNFVLQNCDLLVVLGCRMNIRMVGYEPGEFGRNARIAAVDIDPAELQKPTVAVDTPICSDVKAFMEALAREEYRPAATHEAWRRWCRDLGERYPVVLPAYHATAADRSFAYPDGLAVPMNPYVFIEQLFAKLLPEDRIACANGSACVMTFQAAKIKQGQRLFTNSGCATMGYGLPAAIGACAAGGAGRRICIEGDGSIMMNLQELATLKKQGYPLKIFLLNNRGYHSMRQTQGHLFSPPFVGIDEESGVGFPDFAALAKAFGIAYRRIDSEQETPGAIEEVLAEEKPVLCEVLVDPGQEFAPKTATRVSGDGSVVSAPLMDMAPFLEREEYEGIFFDPQDE